MTNGIPALLDPSCQALRQIQLSLMVIQCTPLFLYRTWRDQVHKNMQMVDSIYSFHHNVLFLMLPDFSITLFS